MLVLSRKLGETIVIGHNVTVKVNRIHGNRVTLGIDAPDDVTILRGELEPLSGSLPHARNRTEKPRSGSVLPQTGPVESPDMPMGSIS